MAEASTPPNPADEGGMRPVPDPTVLTTDALRREIAGLEKLLDTKLEAAEKLRDEKFRAVDQQLAQAELQRLEQKADTKAAVDAALAAQEKAIAKTEGSVDSQILQLNRTVDTKVEGLSGNYSDLKERVGALENLKAGANEQRTEQRAVTAGQFAVAGVVLVILNIVIGVVIYLATNPPPG